MRGKFIVRNSSRFADGESSRYICCTMQTWMHDLCEFVMANLTESCAGCIFTVNISSSSVNFAKYDCSILSRCHCDVWLYVCVCACDMNGANEIQRSYIFAVRSKAENCKHAARTRANSKKTQIRPVSLSLSLSCLCSVANCVTWQSTRWKFATNLSNVLYIYITIEYMCVFEWATEPNKKSRSCILEVAFSDFLLPFPLFLARARNPL